MQVSPQSSAAQPEAILQWLQKEKLGEAASAAESREVALQERDLAIKEVEKLRNIVKRQRKDLKARRFRGLRPNGRGCLMNPLKKRSKLQPGNPNFHFLFFYQAKPLLGRDSLPQLRFPVHRILCFDKMKIAAWEFKV